MVFIILGVAAWFAFMVFAMVLPINPQILKITRVFVCPPESEMTIKTEVYSYHHPGQKAILVYCDGPEGRKDIKVRSLVILWIFFFILSVPIGTILVFWLSKILTDLT